MSYLTEHAADLFDRSEYEIAATAFLSPAEQREIFDALPAARARLVFWGGAIGCERRCAFFVPEWALDAAAASAPAPSQTGKTDGDTVDAARDPDDSASSTDGGESLSFPRSLAGTGAFSDERERAAAILDRDGSLTGDRLCAAHIEGSAFRTLTHRDFMGAILNLGIKREALGDIAVLGESSADAYCTARAGELIAAELKRIGRDGVRATVRAVGAFERITREFETLTVIVASMRLDCVVGELANVSRESAKRLIASGAVELDHRESADADERVAEGATVSVRGAGKYRIGETLGETRSARLRLRVLKYV